MATDLNGAFPRETISLPAGVPSGPANADGGKSITLSPQTFATEQLFKEYLECEALKSIQRKRAAFAGESEYQDAIRAVSRDFAARVYAWGRPECRRCLEDDANLSHFFWLVIQQRTAGGENSPNAWLLRSQWDEVWREAGTLIVEAWMRISDPNRTKPTDGTASPSAA